MPNVEVERRVDLRIVEFHQHVVAGDAELGRAKGDKRGDVKAAHANQIERRLAGRKAKLARTGILERGLRLYTEALQQRHHLAEDPSVRQRQD